MDLGDFAARIAEAKAMVKSIGGDANVDLNVQAKGLALAAAEIAAATKAANEAGNSGGGGFRWFGLTAASMHWIIAGGAEILAVTVPAMIALGAAAAVAAEGVQHITQHMESVYTATEATSQMFRVTAGQAVGLRGALQAAQTAADPSVYGILGSAVLTVNEHFGNLSQAGLDVIRTFQTFSAKVVQDFGPNGALGSTTDELLAHMQSDLTGIGQLFGNLGHATALFASQMPGLAEVLLSGAAGAAGFAEKVLQLSSDLSIGHVSLLTAVMGYEEFNRWGALAVGVLDRLGIASNGSSKALAAGAFSFGRFDSVLRSLYSVIPNAIGGFGTLATRLGADGVGAAASEAADGIGMAISSLSTWELVGVTGAIAAAGFLIAKFGDVQSAAQKMGTQMQDAVAKASNVQATGIVVQNIAALNAQLTKSAQITPKVEGGYYGTNAEIRAMANNAHALHAALQQQNQDLLNVTAGANYLANTYHTTLVGGMELATLANVQLYKGITGSSQAAQIARLQIASLAQGYTSMGQSSGEVGQDMTALAIQSGLASSQVSKLNSAWDDFMSNLTGGTGGLGSFVQSIQNMGTVVASVKNNLGQASSISLTTGQFAKALTNFGSIGSQAWSNFDQVVGSTAPQLIDWFRTAGAEGALSSQQFSKAVLGMVSSLTAFASKSPTAQAELLGLVQQVDPNIKSWGQLTSTLKDTGASIKDTQAAVQAATIKMGDMAQVAQNLGNVLQSALLTALSQAKIQASGAGAAMLQYEQDIRNGTAATAAGQGARQQLIHDLEFLGYNAKQAASLIQMVAGSLNSIPRSVTSDIYVRVIQSGGSVSQAAAAQAFSHKAGGYASGTSSAAPGWAWVGEAGPELVKFSGGEQVMPHGQSASMGDGGMVEVHSHVHLDGKEIYRTVKQESVTTQRRSGTNGLARRTR